MHHWRVTLNTSITYRQTFCPKFIVTFIVALSCAKLFYVICAHFVSFHQFISELYKHFELARS